jgi:RHS repeat-associated protein
LVGRHFERWLLAGLLCLSATGAMAQIGARMIGVRALLLGNAPPAVSITAPASGASFTAPAAITLMANASDPDGTIAKVDFYQGTTLIGTSTASPYTFNWTGVPAGSYSLTAVATDNEGDTTTSTAVPVTVSVASANLYFIHVDHLNTPRAIYDDQQQLRWKWDQAEPFGVNTPDENPSGLGVFELPLGLSLYYRDRETGNFYAMHRDAYSPGIGRFPQSDPIGLGGGINTYVYVGGNPLAVSDPTGRAGQLIMGCTAGAWAGPLGCGIGAGVAMLGTFAGATVLMSATGSDSQPVAKPKTVSDVCPKCQATKSRSIAMAEAYAWAGVPMSGGPGFTPITWRNFNLPAGMSRGDQPWAEFMRQYGAPSYGVAGVSGASVTEHPFGHPDQPGELHHDCPHFHATNAGGQPAIFIYKPGSP